MIGQADSEDRAVSPVIGVILMVAIVVILAATVATMMTGMVDDMGTQEARGAVDFTVENDSNETVVEATSMQNADYIELRGDVNSSRTFRLGSVGNVTTLSYDNNDLDSVNGTITAVAVLEADDGDLIETRIDSQDYDFS